MKNTRKTVAIIFCVMMMAVLSGCAALDSAINDFKGNLVGNDYTITSCHRYHLKTHSSIDMAISRALREKRNFNKRKFASIPDSFERKVA